MCSLYDDDGGGEKRFHPFIAPIKEMGLAEQTPSTQQDPFPMLQQTNTSSPSRERPPLEKLRVGLFRWQGGKRRFPVARSAAAVRTAQDMILMSGTCSRQVAMLFFFTTLETSVE